MRNLIIECGKDVYFLKDAESGYWIHICDKLINAVKEMKKLHPIPII